MYVVSALVVKDEHSQIFSYLPETLLELLRNPLSTANF